MKLQKGTILIAIGVGLILIAGAMLVSSLGAVASNWAYEMTGIRAAQRGGLDGTGVVVAVVDTGFDPTHPSLIDSKVLAWRDYVNNRAAPYDDVGHGSHVTGIVVGKGSNLAGRLQGFEMRGAAPGVGLVIVKAIDKEGTGSSSNVAAGIDFAVQQNADIICLSLGAREPTLANQFLGDEITNSVNNAINRGILVVAAAGNTGQATDRDDVESPATIPRVIAVGAVDEDGHVADFSARGSSQDNYGLGGTGIGGRPDPGKKPEIVAPGVDIKSAWKEDAYAVAKGTSQAAPFVCGSLALLLQQEPSLRGDNSAGMIDRVKNAIKNTAKPLEGQRRPHDNAAGYGLLQTDRLLAQF